MSVRYELRGVEYPGLPRSIWRFGDPECPLRLAKPPKGVGGAPIGHVRQANARQAGATWRGLNREINLITLEVHVGPVESGETAVDLWHTWRASLGDGQALAEFHALSPGGGDRFQYVRRETAIPDPSFELLTDVGWCTETAVLGSDESWWLGQTVNPVITPDLFAGRTIRNDGDADGWLLWALTGPGRYSIGVGTESVTLPMLAPGEVWTVETNPEYPHIRNAAGVDVWESAGNIAWYQSVPPGATVPLNISGTSLGSASQVEVWMPQKYERAAA
ncbi:hypothetical protein [Nocardia testacea]|uniref:hypothetical protein n=1 Tax=Nocardia testacea TaxID=248551 RepID=UPI00031C67DE|nr:hypothetical protein [Nocardia testacea]